jgi:hypothetical protein
MPTTCQSKEYGRLYFDTFFIVRGNWRSKVSFRSLCRWFRWIRHVEPALRQKVSHTNVQGYMVDRYLSIRTQISRPCVHPRLRPLWLDTRSQGRIRIPFPLNRRIWRWQQDEVLLTGNRLVYKRINRRITRLARRGSGNLADDMERGQR